MAAGDILQATGSLTPSRAAIKMIATADEAFLIDVFAAARVSAGDTTGSVSAWVNIPDITGDYGIWSCGDTAAIEFVTMRITAGKLVVELNDATADKFEHTSDDIIIKPHKWTHIAITQDASTKAPQLYVDGKKVDQTATLATDNTLWFADLALTDDGSIGAAEEAGAAGQIRECKGGISDVKYWNTELTALQIEEDYNGTPNTTNLTDHWKMEDAVNSVTAANFGVKGASIQYVNEYSEFTSRMSFLGQVVADDFSISVNEREGHIIIIKAA